MTAANQSVRRLVLVSLLAAAGLVMFVFESFLPVLPWFRPGLGNAATLIALMVLGFNDALKVTVLRILLGALVLGRLFTPVFVLAIAGGAASVLVMAAVHRWGRPVFGPVGVSIAGAAAHNAAQLVVAAWLMDTAGVFLFLPVFTLAGIATGILVGIVSMVVVEHAGKRLRGMN